MFILYTKTFNILLVTYCYLRFLFALRSWFLNVIKIRSFSLIKSPINWYLIDSEQSSAKFMTFTLVLEFILNLFILDIRMDGLLQYFLWFYLLMTLIRIFLKIINDWKWVLVLFFGGIYIFKFWMPLVIYYFFASNQVLRFIIFHCQMIWLRGYISV